MPIINETAPVAERIFKVIDGHKEELMGDVEELA